MTPVRIPVSTYRLQFNREFDFTRARELVPYLHALGITDIYASPLLGARRGSPHGYDVTDPTRINPELGGEEGMRTLVASLHERGMGLLLDVVPNHMAASPENPWWFDLLRWGPDSPYAAYFDLDWQPARTSLAGKVLLPILGSPYGDVLEKGELSLTLTGMGFGVAYHQQWLPLKPASHGEILEYAGVTGVLQRLAGVFLRSPGREEFLRAVEELWRLYTQKPPARDLLNEALLLINNQKEKLDEILSGQYYRLAFWKAGREEVNYRRFFDVAELVSLRMEEERVFEATHSLVLELARQGTVTGFRIDHIDGLRDPQAYLERLQARLQPAGSAGGSPARNNFFVVVEKILTGNEELPPQWPVYGTTGYDFLNLLNALYTNGDGLDILEAIYRRAEREVPAFEEVVYACKKKVLRELFAGEVRALVHQLDPLAAADPRGRDLSLKEQEKALVALTACLPVYRTYIREEAVSDRDRDFILQAVEQAGRLNPELKRAIDFLRRVLLLEVKDRAAALKFSMRWQQFTGPAMAKGFEDTALYIYNRLISLNEVGGNPGTRGLEVEEFHRNNLKRYRCQPHTLNATSTHDTKRSEDVRARLHVLSEIPHLFAGRLERWQEMNRNKKPLVKGQPVPEANMELFIYQTLLGAWPLEEGEMDSFKQRLREYLLKAAREAKTRTSWLNPDPAYEEALLKFVETILEDDKNNRFRQDFLEFQKITAFYGAIYSLAQVLLKIASPGIPDFYQGTELWNFSLVDPDNRRPVDFTRRMRLLTGLQEKENSAGLLALAKELLSTWPDGRVKLYLTYKALHFRRARRELFQAGEYIPLQAAGPLQRHLCAFARRAGESWALVVVPRLVACLNGREPQLQFPVGEKIWGETALILPARAPDRWLNIFTGEEINSSAKGSLSLAEVFRHFPAALLENAG
ncbi:MAG: malto-oligosyltrehalose synthase [Thermoanaerobacter sp.]|nr:malto-oligosyltrehalose synthase [Thermoanaerobacter sp.]